MVCHSGRKHLYQGLLLVPAIISFLSLSNKNLVIVSAAIHIHALGKQGEIKTVSSLKRLHCTGAVLPKVLKVLKCVTSVPPSNFCEIIIFSVI